MDKVQIYQFRKYNVETDEIKTSRRWGTREAISNIAEGEILEGTMREVDASAVQSDIPGLTAIDYNPDRTTGFQKEVKW